MELDLLDGLLCRDLWRNFDQNIGKHNLLSCEKLNHLLFYKLLRIFQMGLLSHRYNIALAENHEDIFLDLASLASLILLYQFFLGLIANQKDFHTFYNCQHEAYCAWQFIDLLLDTDYCLS